MSTETDEQVAHHVEILMHHDTGQSDFRATAEQYAELFRQLVPDEGEPETIQGKVVLSTSKLASELRRNGNINWGPFFETMVDTLETQLVPAQTNTADRTRVEKNLKRVRENGTRELEYDLMRITFGQCIEDVVRFAKTIAT